MISSLNLRNYFENVEFTTTPEYTILLMHFFVLPSLLWAVKNYKSGELIKQNVTEQHYFAPREAWNWQKFVLVKWRIAGAHTQLSSSPLFYKCLVAVET